MIVFLGMILGRARAKNPISAVVGDGIYDVQ